MKKWFLVFLLAFSVSASFAGSSKKKVTYVAVVTNVYGGGSATCSQWGGPVSVGDGAVYWSAFPNVQRCYRNSSSASWNIYPSYCAGYSNFNGSTSAPVQDGSMCWRWTCYGGYVMDGSYGNECVTLDTFCARRNMIARDGECIPQWCPGWNSGYNRNSHYLVVNRSRGGCGEFRCRSLTWFASASDRSCVYCAPTRGINSATDRSKCYANGNDNGDGVGANASGAYKGDAIYNVCSSNEYVTNVGGRWKCATIPTVNTAAIEKCWNCPDKKALIGCLSNGTLCGTSK